MTSPNKLNILCLHGYRQNAAAFSQKIGSFRKSLKSMANFTFIDAPHRAKPLTPEDDENEEQRGWWFNQSSGIFDIQQGDAVIGFDESLRMLEETWSSGNFDGILAFSQGASFLSAVCGMKMKNLTSINPSFVILACGFRSVSSEHSHFYDSKIDIPSLHVSGTSDQVIPHEMHLLLEEAFESPVVYHHDGGHHLPATVAEKTIYKNFFEAQLRRLRIKS